MGDAPRATTSRGDSTLLGGGGSAAGFLTAALRAATEMVPNFFVKRSTRPSVSINFCRPVKNGWQAPQISRCSSFLVERVLNVLPHAQRASTSWYFG